MRADHLAAAIEGALAMALDPGGASAWLDECIGLFGAAHTVIGVFDPARAPRLLLNPANRSDLDRYEAAGIAHLDPQLTFLPTLDRPQIYFDVDHVDESDAGTRTFQSWLRSEVKVGHHMTAFVPLGDGAAAGLSVHAFVDDGFFADEKRQAMAALFPALSAGLKLGLDHAEKLIQSFWDGVAATTAEAALLLDEQGRVVRLTRRADALLARSDALDIVGGRLRCGDGEADARLQRAIAGALRPPTGVAGGLRLPHRSGRAPLVATIYPLAHSRRTLAPFEAAALVLIVDPLVAKEPSLHADLFGLTPSEAALARLLMAGHSVESAATVQGVSVATARLHLRRLLAKTGTTRQTDLVRLLGRL